MLEETNEKLSSGIEQQLAARNPEHPFLKAFKDDKILENIKSLWDKGKKDEAARILRAELTKIANSKLGLAILLMVSGAAITSAGYDALAKTPEIPPIPQPPQPPDSEMYTIKKGDSIWKIVKAHMPAGTSNEDIMTHVKQVAADNGMNIDLIDSVLTKTPGDPDLIFPGGKLILNNLK